MAKKKKNASKRKDTRGYVTQQQPQQKPKAKDPRQEQGREEESKQKLQVVESGQNDGMDSKTKNTMIKAPPCTVLENQLPLDGGDQKEQQQDQHGNGGGGGGVSVKFMNKLSQIVQRLLELGFTEHQLEEAVADLGYDMTSVETALDWFCLNQSAINLPPLFTDGKLRDALQRKTNDDTLKVLKLVAPPTNDIDVDDEGTNKKNLPVQSSSNPSTHQRHDKEKEAAAAAAEKKQNDEAAAQKAWLLQQYQYEDEYDDENQHRKEEDEAAPLHSDEVVALSPQELQLAEQEKELKLLEADLNDDASNYMRSKQEMKQLQSQVKKLRLQVGGLRKKIEKSKNKTKNTKPKQEEGKRTTNTTSDEMPPDQPPNIFDVTDDGDEGGYGGGLFDTTNDDDDEEDGDYGGGLFDAPNIDGDDNVTKKKTKETMTPTTTTAATTTSKKKSLIDCTIAKDWTGTTPQKTLEEKFRKQKYSKPKFLKLSNNSGYKLIINLGGKSNNNNSSKQKKSNDINKQQEQQEWQAENKDFIEGSSVREYLAAVALYSMDSSLPLYRIFPPTFKSLWLSWLDEVKEQQNLVQQEQDTFNQQRIDRLVSLIETHHKKNLPKKQPGTDQDNESKKTYEKKNTDEPIGHGKEEDDEVVDNWDDVTDDGNEPSNNDNDQLSRSEAGMKLRDEFIHRQRTNAYQEMKTIRDSLPMSLFRTQVLETIRGNPVTILCAQTGAGKTTQCPQYILEDALVDGKGDTVQIICTQPRRVAATSVAERVAEEMCERKIGQLVGYQIRMEAKKSDDTKLLFCTTGIILRRLQDDPNLHGITHVIVDEVHERQQQTDILLVVLRILLRTTRKDLKVILMSATLDANLFSSFFDGAPLVNVPGRTFPVANYYLEDLIDATDHIIEEGSRYALREDRYNERASLWVTTRSGEKRREVVDLVSQTDVTEVSDLYPDYKMTTRRSMDRVNEEMLNYDLIEDVLELLLIQSKNDDGTNNTTLMAPDGADLSSGSILIFFPGLGEIRTMTERLQANRKLGGGNNNSNNTKFDIIPMHSTLSSHDQRKAFVPTKYGRRKIILSTNIAETSVTIPDVVCVLDCGRVREVRRNKRTSTSILVTDWCSRASAKQRGGRAGRVQPGLCLKLFSSQTEKRIMKANSEPELCRVPLEEVCLSILASGFASKMSCQQFLSQAPQPPPNDSIEAAIRALEEVGAVVVIDDDDGDEGKEKNLKTNPTSVPEQLTPLGHHLAKLPVDVRLGKMLIYGVMFRCIDKVLTIAAALSCQSPFSNFVGNNSTNNNDASTAKAQQKKFADNDSDFYTLCNVWESYKEATDVSFQTGRKFCRTNYLNFMSLREMGDARRQYFDLLCSIGFIDRRQVTAKSQGGGSNNSNNKNNKDNLQGSFYNQNANNRELVHAVICAGLSTNVAKLETNKATGDFTMHHKNERIFFHRASVNAAKKFFSKSDQYICFFEKFGTTQRVSVSTTCLIDQPIVLLLFGGQSITIKHTERLVLIDDWMEITMAAQTAVVLREMRQQVNTFLLQGMMTTKTMADGNNKEAEAVVKGIIDVLASAP